MATNTTKFEFTVAGNEAAKTASLATSPGGPIKVHNTHLLAVALEAAGVVLPSTGADHRVLKMHMLEDLSLTSIVYTEALRAEVLTYYIKPTAWSALFRSLEGAGLAFAATSYAEVQRELTVAIAALPLAEKTFDVADVLHTRSGTPTGTWYDHATALACAGGMDNNSKLIALKRLVPTPMAPSLLTDGYFLSCVEMLQPAGITGHRAQFQTIKALLPERPRFELVRYVAVEHASDEITRVLAKSEDTKFAPVFDAVFPTAFPYIAAVFPAYSTGPDLRAAIATTIQQLGWTGGVVDATVAALERLAKKHGHNLASLGTGREHMSSRGDRLVDSINAESKDGSGAVTSSDAKGSSNKSAEEHAWSDLYPRADYKTLLRAVEALAARTPVDLEAAATLLMSSTCAVGWLRMNGTDVPQRPFRALRAAIHSVSPTVLISALNTKLTEGTSAARSATSSGELLVSEKLALATVKARLAPGSGANEIDYWTVFQPFIVALQGADSVRLLAPLAQPEHVLLDPERLVMLTKVVPAWFEFMGFPSGGSGNITGVLRNLKNRAEQLSRMRHTEKKKAGLTRLYLSAARRIFTDFANGVQAMLQAPASTAARPAVMLAAGSPAAQQWAEFETDLEDTLKEHRRADKGLANDESVMVGPPARHISLAELVSGSGSVVGTPGSAAGSSVLSGTTLSGYNMDSASTAGSDSWRSTQSWQQAWQSDRQKTWPPGVEPEWGDMMAGCGAVMQEGKLYIGVNQWQPKTSVDLDCKQCLAKISPPSRADRRGKYCSKPTVCKSSSDHERPDGLADDGIVEIRPDGYERYDEWIDGHGKSYEQIVAGSTVIVPADHTLLPDGLLRNIRSAGRKRSAEDRDGRDERGGKWPRGRGGGKARTDARNTSRGKGSGKGGGKSKGGGKNGLRKDNRAR